MELVRSRSYDLDELVYIILNSSQTAIFKRIDLNVEQISEPFL